MKLYAWQPKGYYGPLSFFVMAETEAEARRKVELHLARNRVEAKDVWDKINSDGWGTDHYKLTVAEPGDVITNENQ